MTLLPNYPSTTVKDPDNLLMARVVDQLIAQLINQGAGKAAAPGSLTASCLKPDFKVKRWRDARELQCLYSDSKGRSCRY